MTLGPAAASPALAEPPGAAPGVTPGVALLFPGQGSQYPQMGRDVARCPRGRSLIAEAEAISGLPLADLMSTADAVRLADPEVAQLSVLVHSLALLDQVQAAGVRPTVVAGHSLGEYSAMVAAGMLDVPTAIRLVSARGRAMAAAARHRDGTMGAVVGLPAEQVQELCRTAPAQPVVVANVNSPRQLVISGVPEGVDTVLAAAQQAGALRAKRLRVGGAYHSPLMAPAAATMAARWDGVTLRPPRCRFVSSTTGQPVDDPGRQAAQMRDQVGAPVQWRGTLRVVADLLAGCSPATVLEVGPGRVLAGLTREQAPHLRVVELLPGRPLRLPVTLPPAGRTHRS